MNISNVDLLLDISNNCNKLKCVHLKLANRCNTIYNTLVFAGILSGPLSATITGLSSNSIGSGNNILLYTSIGISILSSIIMSSIKLGKFEELTSSHKLSSNKYSILSNDIQVYQLESSDNVDKLNYIKYIQKTFNKIGLDAPLLSESIIYDKTTEVDVSEDDVFLNYELSRLP